MNDKYKRDELTPRDKAVREAMRDKVRKEMMEMFPGITVTFSNPCSVCGNDPCTCGGDDDD
jgi:hypothetical protein